MDRHTPEQRRKNMQAIKSKDSEIELKLRKELWRRGLRYRKNVRTVYGHPDIAFISKKVAIFVDGEFWHGYDWVHQKNNLKSHQEYWVPKIERNMQRDKEVNQRLEEDGWCVLRFWGHEIIDNVELCAGMIEKVLTEKQG